MASSRYYFYTDYENLINSNNQPFGPEGIFSDGGINYERFRITEKHTLSVPQNVYAICSGQVIYQYCSDNPDLLNIILKPTESFNNLPEILCIIYRGIKKSSLLDSIGNISSPLNTITHNILEDFTSPNSSTLGLELNTTNGFDDNYLIEKMFNTTPSGLTVLTVSGGDCLGQFEDTINGGNGSCVEILLKRVGFNPTLALARKLENFVDVKELETVFTVEENHLNKIGKENILNYLDVCSFYGNLTSEKLHARISTDTIDTGFKHFGSNYKSFKKNTSEFYLDVLNRFQNKNSVYLDIRNEFGFSYNYFNIYGNNISLLIDNSTSNYIDKNYYEDYPGITGVYKWPLLKIVYPSSNTNPVLKFKLPKGDNKLPLGYVQAGVFLRSSNQKRNKTRGGYDNFLEFKYVEGSESEYNDEIFEFELKTESGNVLPSYNKFKYLRKIESPYNGGSTNIFRQMEYIDFAFQPLGLSLPFDDSFSVKVNIYNDDFYFDLNGEFGLDFVGPIGIAKDSEYTYLFSFPIESTRKGSFDSKNYINIKTGCTNNFTSFIKYLEKRKDDSSTDNSETIIEINERVITATDDLGTFTSGISKFELQPKTNRGKIKISMRVNKEFILIIIPNTKYDDIINKVNDAELTTQLPIFLKANQTPYIGFDSTGDTKYIKYEFQLIGFKPNSGGLFVVETIHDALSENGDTDIKLRGYDYSKYKAEDEFIK
jgi:hypothetical protein